MPPLGLPTGTLERSVGGLPRIPIVNMVSESAITEPTQFVLQSRANLQRYLSSAYGAAVPIRAIHYSERQGYFFVVYSTTLDGPATTTLNGSLVPSIAENQIGVIVTAGSAAKFWDGSAWRSISFPDGANVIKVLESQGRFLFIRESTQRYYWTEPLSNMLDGSGDIVIDGLAYASAENNQDWLIDGLIWQDRVIAGGKETIEIHAPSGNDDQPWEPVPGSTIHKGVAAAGSMCLFDNTFVWQSPEGVIWKYTGGTEPQRISNPGIEEILKFGPARLDSFFFEGREFLHAWIDDGGNFGVIDGDLLLDSSTGEWCEWETDGGIWDAGPSTSIADAGYPIFGAKSDTRVLGMSTREVLPGGSWENSVEHRFGAGLAIDGGGVDFSNVLLRCKTYTSGTETISMRFSTDKGVTWTNWFTVTLTAGRVQWDGLGRMFQPGFLAQFKTANCSEFSVSGAYYNEFVQGA